jgi:hypothetical protein
MNRLDAELFADKIISNVTTEIEKNTDLSESVIMTFTDNFHVSIVNHLTDSDEIITCRELKERLGVI